MRSFPSSYLLTYKQFGNFSTIMLRVLHVCDVKVENLADSTKKQELILTRRRDRTTCKDYKVISGEAMTTQHRLVVLDVNYKV